MPEPAAGVEDGDRYGEGQNEDGGDENRPAVAQLWYHTHEDISGHESSVLVLTVGFPEPQFSELIDACVTHRADTIVLDCRCHVNTTGWTPFVQTGRDLILSPGETITLEIDDATLSGAVRTLAPIASAIMSEGDDGDEAGDNEAARRRSNGAPPIATAVAYTLLLATIAVCGVLAFLGAGAVLVLSTALLGATAAVVATLHSIGRGVIERLTTDER